MGRIFGTDGVRGVANGDLTPELAMNLGRAAGMVVEEATGRRPTFLVGKDTRISSDMALNPPWRRGCAARGRTWCCSAWCPPRRSPSW